MSKARTAYWEALEQARLEFKDKEVAASLREAQLIRTSACVVFRVSKHVVFGGPGVAASMRSLTPRGTNQIQWATTCTDGYAVYLYGGIVSYCSKQIKVVALSSAEAEYAAAAHTTREVLFVQNMLSDLNVEIKKPTVIFIDNQAAIKIAENLGVTNDELAESVFGTYDMILRRCPGISMEAASAVAQSVRSKMLTFGDHVARRKQSRRPKEEASVSGFHKLPEREQEALVLEFARRTVKEMRDVDRADHRALDEYHAARRKTNEQDELDALFTQYALALSFFERWCKRGVETANQISSTLCGYGERNQDKLDWLREQIEMRTIGLSWSGWSTPWSSSTDEHVGTVEQLRDHLKEVMAEEKALERKGMLPSKERALASKDGLKEECPPPQLRRKTYKALGTPTVQAGALSCDKIDLDPQQLLAAAEQRREDLEARGEIDWVCDRQPYASGQGPTPDKGLVGKVLEVRWRYRHRETGEAVYIWCEGEVIQAADGESDKRTARCTKVLPAGALRIKWPADVEFDEDESFVWCMLNPRSFNKDVHLGWRFAASELKKMEQQAMQAGHVPPAKKRRR